MHTDNSTVEANLGREQKGLTEEKEGQDEGQRSVTGNVLQLHCNFV